MSLLDFLAGLLIAVLAGLGVGSGGLFTVYLTLAHGTPQPLAQGMNLFFFVFALAASAVIAIRRGAYEKKTLLTVLSLGAVGAVLGSFLSGFLPGLLVRRIFGGFLAIAGLFSLKQDKKIH